ncbi:hypothetical protein CAPTEDRAFT_220681 [Capitella teleta]|uniref:NF-kappa-B inhibitor-like protein 1 n=1 Tax=Capitella teleta TaxID=283909 RepID=R7UWM7_CAPTE|nr:hypothetical protein CAPTEDRAFT_220681 [Capitella teleta]|eukprot:ELU10704.1 hypothetical protein CAPTEDRAFT_220681 [Capitella teleta]
MREKYLKKLRKLLKQDKFSKLKSFFKKYDVNVNEILDEKQNTALHIACKYGHDAIALLLIKRGAGCLASNADGNLPLHLACKFALRNRHAYTDLVLPLMKNCRRSLDVRNSQGVTPRELLSEIKDQLQGQFHEDDSTSCESEIEEEDWREKLAHEVQGEDMFAAYENDYQYEGRVPNTYDNWADSMNKQYHRKHNQPHFASTRKRSRFSGEDKNDKKPKISDEKKEEFAKKLQEEYKKKKEKEKNEQSKEARKIYDLKCKAMFGPLRHKDHLHYKDIPWPFATKNCSAESVTSFLFADLAPASSGYKDYLRQQQIRWHPDRFMQKCRERLVEADLEKIVSTVKDVSQILNALSDKS